MMQLFFDLEYLPMYSPIKRPLPPRHRVMSLTGKQSGDKASSFHLQLALISRITNLAVLHFELTQANGRSLRQVQICYN